MKVQFISHIPGDFHEKRKAHLHFVPFYLEKMGYKVNIIHKKSWPFFYWEYLKFKPDVMIVSGIIAILPTIFKRIGLIRKPIIYYWGDYFHETMGAKWGPDKCAFIEFYCAKKADYVTTPSFFLNNVGEIVGIKTQYLPHGYLEEIKQIKKSHLPELNQKQKKLLKFIYLGDVNTYKRVDRIINAVKGKQCVLYIIGKEYGEKVIKDLPENVIYLPEMSHEKAIQYTKACDIAVITSDQDSTLKMFEFMALGMPMLAFNGRINYVLRHMDTAYLTADMNEGVDRFIKEKDLALKISSNLKKMKVSTWEDVGKEYDRIIKILTKKDG